MKNIEVEIQKLVHGGDGVASLDGKTVFVPFSVPGDVCIIDIIEEHENFARGQIVSVLKASDARVTPRCPVFYQCGGCQWQHISYETQLKCKREILKDSLERLARLEDVQVLETLASPKQWYYRNRIQLHVNSKGKVGFYRSKSKEVVEFERCFIADERLNRVLKEKRSEISKRDRGISLRVEDGPPARTEPLLRGEGPSFLQINSEQNEELKKKLVSWLREVPHESVLELYAGAGNFTFEIAKTATRVVASDCDKGAIAMAKNMAEQKNVKNIEFVCSPLARAARRMGGVCDVVVLDPPRKGAAEAILDIAELEPQNIFYISCDPATLSRDIKTLKEHGYSLKKSLPVDMFPQTYHVESLSLLTRSRLLD